MTPTNRWTALRKMALINAIAAGEITEAALNLPPYNISPEELAEWRDRIRTDGVKGLRVRVHRKHRGQPG